MLKIYILQDDGAHLSISKEEVRDILEHSADRISTTSSRYGIQIKFDGAGEHTKKLPNSLHSIIYETEGAKFAANRDNQRHRQRPERDK